MEKLYNDNKDVAEFYMVYISEAHAVDDRHPVSYAKELGIMEHKTYGERCTTADRLFKDKPTFRGHDLSLPFNAIYRSLG